MLTWSSLLPEVGIVSTLAGCASVLSSEASAAAVTWAELDYSREAVIPPQDWMEFADEHRWNDVETVERLFAAAAEIALRRLA